MVGGVVYCRRHASTVTAMGPSTQGAGYPELENRGPSLVSWLADELTVEIERLLAAVATTTERVVTEHELGVVFDQKRRRRWERSWKLIESTGITLKVTLSVNENGDDGLVDVRAGSNVIARGVPPWVARRRAGLTVDDQVDAQQRELFHRFILDHIAREVAVLRAQESSLA